MNKLISFGIVALFVAAAIPSVDAQRTESHSYIPGALNFTIWCSEAEHPIIPIGDPGGYDEDPVWSAYGWAFSGEPECAPHDAYNAAREAQGEERTTGGYGGAAYTVHESEKLSSLFSNTDDEFFGVGQSYQELYAGREPNEDGTRNPAEVSAGCGPQTITIPEDIRHHWQNSLDNPLYIAWVSVYSAMVDQDLNVCFSSTGMVTGTFS